VTVCFVDIGGIVDHYSDRERFLLNGPMAPSSKFQWAIQKMNGPYHKPNGHSLHAFFVEKVCFQVLSE
jgi:hypothetical protein